MEFEEEQIIIRQIQKGNLGSYKILVDRYSGLIMNLCYRYLNSTQDAEDATQDVFVKAYIALQYWEPRAQFKTWLYRIAINHCLNLVRRQQKVDFRSLEKLSKPEDGSAGFEPGTPDETAEAQLIRRQKEEQMQKIIRQLPEQQRQVIILYFYQKLSYKEIAEVLDCSMSAIESRLFRAKKTLARYLPEI